MACEAARVPTTLLVHGNNLLPEPGKPPPGFGFLRGLAKMILEVEDVAAFVRNYNDAKARIAPLEAEWDAPTA